MLQKADHTQAVLLRRGGSKGGFLGVSRQTDLKQGAHMWLDCECYLMAQGSDQELNWEELAAKNETIP